ncbi:MAG: histidine phosphatase family protein [Bdellovibrionota bacterium]
MRLLWVRHGQMDGRAGQQAGLDSINRLFNQEVEGALTVRGQREARAVAAHFSENPVHAVYSSPLLRARQTAEATAGALGHEVRVLGEIAEVRTGRLPEGSPEAWLVSALSDAPLPAGVRRFLLGGTLLPLYYRSWLAGRTEGGESPADLRARLGGAFSRLASEHPSDARVALFGHGYIILFLSLALTEGSRFSALFRPYIPNGSITEIEMDGDGRLRLVRYAATEHLRKR